MGNLTSLTDPGDFETVWTHDALNRVVGEELVGAGGGIGPPPPPGGGGGGSNPTRTYEYNQVGNLTKYVDRNDRTTEYAYDALHRRTEEKWLDGVGATIRTFSVGYDSANQLITASDPSASYTFDFDDRGRVYQTTGQFAAVGGSVDDPLYRFTADFDLQDNRTSLSAELMDYSLATPAYVADALTTFQFDALDRLTEIRQVGQAGGNGVAEKRVEFAYDALDRPTEINRYESGDASEFVASSMFSFDQASRLQELTHQRNATLLADYDWDYDNANRVGQFTSSADGAVDYDYDPADQLTMADYTTAPDESYTYADNGNRAGYTMGDYNRVVNDGTYTYQYDDEGNRTHRTHNASLATTEYEWDYRNRLTRITDRDFFGATTNEVEYHYDIFDRRIAKVIDDQTSVSTEYFVHDGQHIALRLDEDGAATNRYLHGPAVDQILADEQVAAPGAAGDVLWTLTDNLGSVRDIVNYDAATDTSTVVNHIVYDSFGNIRSESNSGVDVIFGFTGRETDEESDLYYYRARYYDPAIGQFASEDPIGFAAGDSNLRRYVGNSPTNATDPSGMWEDPVTEMKRLLEAGEYQEYAQLQEKWRGAQTLVTESNVLPLRFLELYQRHPEIMQSFVEQYGESEAMDVLMMALENQWSIRLDAQFTFITALADQAAEDICLDPSGNRFEKAELHRVFSVDMRRFSMGVLVFSYPDLSPEKAAERLASKLLHHKRVLREKSHDGRPQHSPAGRLRQPLWPNQT